MEFTFIKQPLLSPTRLVREFKSALSGTLRWFDSHWTCERALVPSNLKATKLKLWANVFLGEIWGFFEYAWNAWQVAIALLDCGQHKSSQVRSKVGGHLDRLLACCNAAEVSGAKFAYITS